MKKKMFLVALLVLLGCGTSQKKKPTFEDGELDELCFRECERLFPNTCLLGEFGFVENDGVATCACFVSRAGELEMKIRNIQICICKNCDDENVVCPACCKK